MPLSVGREVWVPCEVKPGPFPDERMVRIRTDQAHWVGFAPLSALRDQIPSGPTYIRTLVVEVTGDSFTARPLGLGVSAEPFRGVLAKVRPLGSVET